MWKSQIQKFKHYFHFIKTITVKSAKKDRLIFLQKDDFKHKNHPKLIPPNEWPKNNSFCSIPSKECHKSYSFLFIPPKECHESYVPAHIPSKECDQSYSFIAIPSKEWGKSCWFARFLWWNAAKAVFWNKKEDYNGMHSFIYAHIFLLLLRELFLFL